MDFIKKTICIEDARTRTQGLMPYYEFGKAYEQHSGSSCYTISELGLETASEANGNWGQFVANPCFLVESGKTYEAMLQRYYDLLNMVREGVKLRKVETKEGEIIFTEDIGAFYLDGQCFSGGTEPESLYEYAAYDAEDFTSVYIDSLREETRNIYRADIEVGHNFVVLIKDYDKFQELANYLDGIITSSDMHKKWAVYCEQVDKYIGRINVPASIYNKHIKTPKSMSCVDVDSYIDWLTNYPLSPDCCNIRLWEDMGGNDMLEFLNLSAKTKCAEYNAIIDDIEYFGIPYIEMPLLLTQNYTDLGVLTNIDGVEYEPDLNGPSYDGNDGSRPHGHLTLSTRESGFISEDEIERFTVSGQGITIDQIIMGSSRSEYPTTEEYEASPESYSSKPIEVESLLQTLRDTKKYTDDKNNVLPGLFQEFDNPAGEMFVCLKGDPKYYELQVSTYTRNEETVYCVKYVENSGINDDDIVGQRNFRTSYNEMYRDGLSQQEANDLLSAQETLYNNNDPSNDYRISVVSAAWVMSGLTDEPRDCVNADGSLNSEVKYTLSDDSNYGTAANKKFRTITTPYAGIQIAMTEEEESGVVDDAYTHYFFMVKYSNFSDTPMELPYHVGNTANVYCDESGNCRGDILISAWTTENTFEAKYAIGADLNSDADGNYSYAGGGDIYYEKYNYDPYHLDYVALDGVDNVPVWSEYIDFDGAAKEFYSPRFNLYRTGNTANIIEMTTGDMWNEDYSYDAYLTKEDYLTNFSSPPKVDVNVTIDRGGVSAFEKHYKMSECNTIQDLVNYGNNFFNIE